MKTSYLILMSVLALSAIAEERISFVRQMRGGLKATFPSELYSRQSVGPGMVSWYPLPACWIDSPQTSRTCKVWAIMPLRRVEQNADLPIWHYSMKLEPESYRREPSIRYQIQYLGASAETNTTFGASMEHVFDFDAGDVFRRFGTDSQSNELSLLHVVQFGKRPSGKGILCSSGRIGIEDGLEVLMYGLTVCQNGRCYLYLSVNGLCDVKILEFNLRGGKLYVSGEKLVTEKPYIDTSIPMLAIWLSDQGTVSLRFSRDYLRLYNKRGDFGNEAGDIHVTVGNLQSISDWLSKPQEERGPWHAEGKCSLEKRRIF